VSSSDLATSHSSGHATGHRRKARLSVHDFLPSSMFKSTSDANPSLSTTSVALGSGSTPPANVSIGPSVQGRRKLRKTRSNSDLQMRGTAIGTGGDNPGHLSPPPRSEHFSIEIRDELTAGADPFGQVLGWSAELAADTRPPARAVRSSSVTEDRRDPHDSLAPNDKLDDQLTRRPSVSTSVALSKTVGEAGVAPFGDNVRYTAPVQRSAASLSSQPPQLREMQSFESGLTAKVGDDRDGTPATPRSKSLATDKDVAFLAAKNQARFSTGVFDVLQTYSGLPLPSALLSAPPTGATIKFTLADSANPKDDPRFVIWGEIQPERSFVDDTSVSHSQSSHTDLSNPVSSSGPGSRKRSNARSPQSSNDAPQVVVNSEAALQTVIIAATVERWIAQLTSQFDYDELLNFLLTYRTYISPVDLCHLLICRFHWTLERSSSVQDETVKRIVGVRTFIAIRYWLLTFFREDFLPNVELCSLFASWLNMLSKDPALTKRPDVLVSYYSILQPLVLSAKLMVQEHCSKAEEDRERM
jgi:Gdp/GTP exchange factor required for growth at low temperatures